MATSGPTDARRIFTGIASAYERAGALLSFGQDPRWRRALVEAVRAAPGDRVLDVATGTGLVAREVERRYGCRVVGLDQSADMLATAAQQSGDVPLVRARAEALPFADGSFDHVTFTYLLRYVDDPATVLRELVRIVRPGGRVAALDFGVPRGALPGALWRLYTRLGLPLVGRVISRRWGEVGAFLGGSIERFSRAHPQPQVDRYWREAGLVDLHVRRMSFGAGVVMSATKSSNGAEPPERQTRAIPLGSAFYALRPGGWRDYWTLLHPPYTVWHLSFVILGAALAPAPDPRIVAGGLLAFFLAVGVAAHSFDELRDRPLGTRIPARALFALGIIGLGGAVALGLVAATLVGMAYLAIVAIGAALVALYGLETPLVHSDVGFAAAWGGFPVVATGLAAGAPPFATLVAAVGASLLSLAQRRLSTPVRRIRRKSIAVSGEVSYRDGSSERLDAARLIAAPEAALRLLWLATLAISVGALLARWTAP